MLRKGFTLISAPGGASHLSDTRTGDALVIPEIDIGPLTAAAMGGLPLDAVGSAGVLERYGAFLIEGDEATARGFYELDIEDAPGLVNAGPVVPLVPPVRAGEELRQVIETTRNSVAPDAEAELRRAIETARASPEPVGSVAPTAEDELRNALETARKAATAEQPDASGKFLSQEDNLKQALAKSDVVVAPPPVESREEVAALLDATAKELELPGPLPAPAPKPPPSRRPVVLTIGAVALLAVGVAASLLLHPGSEVAPSVVDAGVALVPEVVDAGVVVVVVAQVDAGEVDAGVVAVAPVDAGVKRSTDGWAEASVQARGRVKMADVVANAEGELTWSVPEAQRVKSKQTIAEIKRADGTSQSVLAESVGLVMIKLPSGSAVKRGAALGEIIYYEAWARGLVKGVTPDTKWKCEVVSAAAGEHAECRVSVVASKSGGSLVTVAVEPRWFDAAGDAVLRFAPP